MKQKKLLSGAEITAIVLGAVMALILGSWSVFVVTATCTALVGIAQSHDMAGVRRAVILGALTAAVVVACTWVHNELINQLPSQEEIEPSAKSALVYLGAFVMGVVTAGLLAWFRAQPNDTLRRLGQIAILLAYGVVFPFFDAATGSLWMATIIVCLIYALQSQGLNIVAGFTGLLDLGYVAFFAIGGYTIAFLRSPHFGLEWSFWIVIWVAAALAALFGLILGAPVIPLRGDYLAIVTLGFGEIVPIAFKNLEGIKIYEPISEFVAWARGVPESALCLVGCGDKPFNLTNGTQGISPIGPPSLPFIGDLQTGQYTPWYFIILGILVVSLFLINRLRHSRIGRAMIAVREDELAASSMGVPLTSVKLTAFMVGAMFSGFAGAFYGSYVSFISPDAFDFSISVIVLCMVILGGSGSIIGVLMGALVIKIIDLLLLDKLQIVINGLLQATVFQWNTNPGYNNFLDSILNMTQYKLLLFGLMLVIMMLTRPQGLVPASIAKYPEVK
jgi:branched-chain amino acid transport system permease protein